VFTCSIQGRVALGPDAGHPVERLGQPPCETLCFEPGELCAALDGFSLHARVRVDADHRERLEHLCRYVARPAIATERLSLSPDGKVVHGLRRPWRDGTTHFVFDPLTFLGRLAALVPHSREHQLTYHGVLAPASSWRDMIVPIALPVAAKAQRVVQSPEVPVNGAPARAPGGPGAAETASPVSPGAPRRYRWAELMRRVFQLDVLRCVHCGGRRKLIALITDPFVARRILNHLGLACEAPRIAAARSPPQATFGF
jgi:hypothetical protein